jgi:hypothetical protein
MSDTNEREWEAQELALQAERLERDPARDDSRVRLYRLVARALRQPPPVALPEDFAKQVAARVATAPVISKLAHGGFESVLLAVLVSILFVSAGVVLARGSPSWLPSIHAALSATDSASLRWPLAFVGCIGLSWMLSQGQRWVPPKRR